MSQVLDILYKIKTRARKMKKKAGLFAREAENALHKQKSPGLAARA